MTHETSDDSDVIPLVTNPSSQPSYTNHTRTGEENIRLIGVIPLFLHFVSVIALVSAVDLYVDEHHFNLRSRGDLGDFTPPIGYNYSHIKQYCCVAILCCNVVRR